MGETNVGRRAFSLSFFSFFLFLKWSSSLFCLQHRHRNFVEVGTDKGPPRYMISTRHIVRICTTNVHEQAQSTDIYVCTSSCVTLDVMLTRVACHRRHHRHIVIVIVSTIVFVLHTRHVSLNVTVCVTPYLREMQAKPKRKKKEIHRSCTCRRKEVNGDWNVWRWRVSFSSSPCWILRRLVVQSKSRIIIAGCLANLFCLIMGEKYKPCCCPGLCYIRAAVSVRHKYRKYGYFFLSTETETNQTQLRTLTQQFLC